MEMGKIFKDDFKFDYLEWMKIVKKEINNQSDRATIVIMGSILDLQLDNLLKEYLIDSSEVNKLFSNLGALSTFNNKIAMSYCLGLISEHEFKTLNTFRKIRNNFAHNINANSLSEDASTIGLINNLSIPFGMYVPEVITFKGNEAQPFPVDVFEKSSPKDKLLLAFNYITLYLYSRFLYIEKRKPFIAPTQSELIKDVLDDVEELASKKIQLLEQQKELLSQCSEENNDINIENIKTEIKSLTEDSFYDFQKHLNTSTEKFKVYLKSLQQAIEKSYSLD